MKAATLNEVKKELSELTPFQVLELCMRLAKYKKENKELLSYLLFEAHDEQTYIKSIKAETATQFEEINKTTVYYAKKSIRKILRLLNKYIKYSGIKQTEVELRIYFCQQLKDSGIPLKKSTALNNLYLMQLKKITAALATLHEDLQYDYIKETERL